MSDTPQGAGWWKASDGRWYAPEQHPDYVPPAPNPPPAPPPYVPPAYPQQPGQWGGAPTTTMAPPATPAKSKGGCLKVGLILGAVLLVLIVLAAVLASGGDDSVDTEGASETTAAPAGDEESASTAAPEPTEADEPQSGSREDPLPFGQAHNIGDGWTVKVAAYNPNANELVEAANMFNEDPPPGQQYVVLQMEATYDGEDTRTIFDVNFELLGSGGVTIDADGPCVPPEPAWWTLGEVFPGGTLSGFMCTLVDSAEVPSLVLIAEPTFALSGNRSFLALQ